MARAGQMLVDEELAAVDASLVELRQIPHDCGNCRCQACVIALSAHRTAACALLICR
jgi:hypothetical protein